MEVEKQSRLNGAAFLFFKWGFISLYNIQTSNAMKKLLLLSILSVTLFTACKEDDPEGCGDEKVSLINIYNGTDFAQYAVNPGGNPSPDSSVTYFAFYQSSGGTSRIAISAVLNKFCNKEPFLLSATLELLANNNDIKDSMYATPQGGTTIALPVTTIAAGFYKRDEYITVPDGTTKVSYSHVASFPAQGGWQADSAYFFTQVVRFAIGTNHKLPQ